MSNNEKHYEKLKRKMIDAGMPESHINDGESLTGKSCNFLLMRFKSWSSIMYGLNQ